MGLNLVHATSGRFRIRRDAQKWPRTFVLSPAAENGTHRRVSAKTRVLLLMNLRMFIFETPETPEHGSVIGEGHRRRLAGVWWDLSFGFEHVDSSSDSDTPSIRRWIDCL